MFVIYRHEEQLHLQQGKTNQLLSEEIVNRQQIQNELTEQTHKLKLANVELEQFNYAVSHDLKAPLRAIHNYADFLQEDLQDQIGSEQKQYLTGLGTAVKQSEQLIEDLLQLSRVGRIEPKDLENVTLDVFLKDLVVALDLAKNETVEIAGMWPELCIHKTLLQQIMQNLIINGLKFNESDQKTIRIDCPDTDPSKLEIRIKDNGIGIKEKYFNKVFVIFQRLHGVAKYEGTGIGLTIVKKSIEKLGGKIRMESELNTGTTVWVTLDRK